MKPTHTCLKLTFSLETALWLYRCPWENVSQPSVSMTFSKHFPVEFVGPAWGHIPQSIESLFVNKSNFLIMTIFYL